MVDKMTPRVYLDEQASEWVRWRFPIAMNDPERIRMALNNALFHDYLSLRSLQISEELAADVSPSDAVRREYRPGETLLDVVLGEYDDEAIKQYVEENDIDIDDTDSGGEDDAAESDEEGDGSEE